MNYVLKEFRKLSHGRMDRDGALPVTTYQSSTSYVTLAAWILCRGAISHAATASSRPRGPEPRCTGGVFNVKLNLSYFQV